MFTDKFATFAHDLTDQTLAKYPNLLLTGSSIETAIGDIVDDVPGATNIAPTGADVRAAYDVAPADVKKSTVAEDGTAFNILFRTGKGSLAAPGACRARASVPTPTRRQASRRRPRVWRSSASVFSTTSSRTGSSSRIWRSGSCSCSWRSGSGR